MAVNQNTDDNYSYLQKVWIAVGVVSLVAVLLLLLRATFSVFLLVLAGVLIACAFRGLSSFIQQKTGWKEGITMALAVAGILGVLTGLSWLIGARIQGQAAQLSSTLPATFENAKAQLSQSPLGEKLVNYASSPDAIKKAKAIGSTFFRSSFGALADMYVVLFLGMFFTISPGRYRKGIILLVPPAGKGKTHEVLNKLGSNLMKWLAGKLFAMTVVFILTSVGLLVVGVPLWLPLALMAGLLNFIPNFGPLIAMIPAVLVALMQGPATAGIVAGIYVLVQVVESNFITPLVQQKLVSIPPALIIIAQLLMGALTGGWGLLLATPVLIIVIIVIQTLYVQPMHDGTPADYPG